MDSQVIFSVFFSDSVGILLLPSDVCKVAQSRNLASDILQIYLASATGLEPVFTTPFTVKALEPPPGYADIFFLIGAPCRA